MARMRSKMSARKPGVVELYDAAGADFAEGEWESDWDGNETWHDASEVTSSSPTKEHQNVNHPAPAANMGNAMSAEERSAWIRTTAADLRKENGGAKTRSTTGKLQPTNNPQYRNPMPSGPSAQKRLPPVATNRKSTYDLDDDPPTNLHPPQAQRTDSTPEISPRKVDKKKAKRGDKAVVEITAGADEAEHVAQDVTSKPTTRSSLWVRTSREQRATHEREQEEEADAGVDAEDDADDNIIVADQDGNATEEDDGVPKNTSNGDKPRGPGRPRKAATAASAQSPRKPNKRGGPTKSSDTAAKGRATRSTTNQGRISTRSTTAQGRGTAGLVDNRSTMQIMLGRSSNGRSAVIDLSNRLLQGNAESQPEGDVVEPDEAIEEDQNDEAEDDLFVTDSAQRLPAGQQVDHATPSELEFTAPDEEADDDTTLSDSQTGSHKRKAGSQAAKPNTKKKRSAFTQSNGTGALAESNLPIRLFGQRSAFIEVLDKSDKIGRRVRNGVHEDRWDIKNEDAHVQAAVELCDSAIQRYTALRHQDGPVEQLEDPFDLLHELDARVDGLRGKNNDLPTDRANVTRATEIYFHLIPKLLGLVKAAIVCYEALDTAAEGQDQMSMPHLRTVVTLIELVLDLIESAKEYRRPDSSDHVVQPVTEMRPPLRSIHTALRREMQDFELSQRTQRRQEQQRRDRIAREKEDARRAEEAAQTRQLRRKWQNLHMERMLIEGGLMRDAKRAHLAIPDEYHIEYDHNGIPFEREEVFHPRVGPPPDLVERALNTHWSMVELTTLSDGLKEYTGEHVFERTFRRYCKPGRELNKFNVTEFVVMAVQVKERLIDDQRKKYGDVEKWVLDIPVWTRGQHGEGQENVDEVEVLDEGDLTVSGGNGEA